MIPPVQTTFRHLRPSAALQDAIHAEVAKLATFYDRIINCRVVVEKPHQHHRSGQQYHIRIDLTVPGGELVILHQPSLRQTLQQLEVDAVHKGLEVDVPHKDLHVAIRDAFVAARRRLQDYARRQRGAVKSHEQTPHARVRALFPEAGYGFLEAPDGKVTFSIGVATFTSPPVSVDMLIDCADQLMYAAKQSGKNTVCHAVIEPRACTQ